MSARTAGRGQDSDVSRYPELVKMFCENPDAYIRLASGADGHPANIGLLRVLTNDVVRIPGRHTVAVVDAFVKMVVDGYPRPEASQVEPISSRVDAFSMEESGWGYPFQGITHALEEITRARLSLHQPKSPDSDVIISNLCRSCSQLLEVVRRDLPKLTLGGYTTNELRCMVVTVFSTLAAESAMLGNILRDDKLLETILVCWAHITPSRHRLRAANEALTYLLHQKATSHHDVAIKAYSILGLDTLVSRFRRILQHPDVIDDDLESELRCIFAFVHCFDAPSQKFMLDEGIFSDVIDAMLRQMDDGEQGKRVESVYQPGFQILCLCYEDMFPEYVVGQISLGSLELAAHTFATAVESYIPEPVLKDVSFIRYLWRVLELLQSEGPEELRRWRSEELMPYVRAEMEKIHCLTWHRIRAAGVGDYPLLCKLWSDIAALVGVSEESLRRKWLFERDCIYPLCENRTRNTGKKKWCRRCHTVVYCSSVCQKGHWEEHKAYCFRARH